MEGTEPTVEELERLANAMAQALHNLECPECCDCGWRYQYVELSSGLYQDEWEWACLGNAIVQYQRSRKSAKSV